MCPAAMTTGILMGICHPETMSLEVMTAQEESRDRYEREGNGGGTVTGRGTSSGFGNETII